MRVVILVVALLWGSVASAGILVLRDGRAVRFAGELRRSDGVVVFHLDDGSLVSLRETVVDWPASARASSLVATKEQPADLLLEPEDPAAEPAKPQPLESLSEGHQLAALVHSGRSGPSGPGEAEELIHLDRVEPERGDSEPKNHAAVDLLLAALTEPEQAEASQDEPSPDESSRDEASQDEPRGPAVQVASVGRDRTVAPVAEIDFAPPPSAPTASVRLAPSERVIAFALLPPDPPESEGPVVVVDVGPPQPTVAERIAQLTAVGASLQLVEAPVAVLLTPPILPDWRQPVREVAPVQPAAVPVATEVAVAELDEAQGRLAQERRTEAEIEAERVEIALLEAQRLERLAAARLEAAQLEAARVEAARVEAARVEAARVEAARVEAARLEAARVEAARVEAARLEAARVEAARLEAARLETARLEAARLEAARLEAARLEAARLEAARLETARLEAERIEAVQQEADRLEIARVQAQRLAESKPVQVAAEAPSPRLAGPEAQQPIAVAADDAAKPASRDTAATTIPDPARQVAMVEPSSPRVPVLDPPPPIAVARLVRPEERGPAELRLPSRPAFTTPADGEAVFGAVPVQVRLDDHDRTVTAVEYHVDGKLIGRSRRPPWGITWVVPPARAEYQVEATVQRTDGRVDRTRVGVRAIMPDAEVEVDLVALTVSVTNQKYLFVRELSKSDFVVFEDGVTQELVHFSADPVPLSVLVLVDLSFSMNGPKLEMAAKAVKRLAERLSPDDRLGVATFTETLQVLSPLTNNHAEAATALDRAEADGGTAMFDSQLEALSLLRWEGGKRVMVVVGDGEDYSSRNSLDAVLKEAQRLNVAVYSVGTLAYRLKDGLPDHWSKKLEGRARPNYWTDGLRVRGLKYLRRMSEETGGILYIPKFAGELPYIFAHILSELKSAYSIGYYPRQKASEGGFRAIEVFVNGSGLQARTRKGYYAPSNVAGKSIHTAKR